MTGSTVCSKQNKTYYGNVKKKGRLEKQMNQRQRPDNESEIHKERKSSADVGSMKARQTHTHRHG